MKRAVIFSRVSTLVQDLKQQTEEILKEALKEGYSKEEIIFIEYKESAIKLDEDERKGIQKLKEEISKNDSIECVFIYEISRLSRKSQMLYSIRDYLLDKKINLICLKPYMKLLDTEGNMSQTASIMFSLFSALSESEMMIKKERMLRGKLSRRDSGYFVGGNLLYGYTYSPEDNKITVNPQAASVMRDFFELYGNKGLSIRKIGKDFLERGLLPYTDIQTACVMLRRAINRSEYAGIKKGSYDYPPIISKELWFKVRERAEIKNTYRTRTKGIYFCQGLIKDHSTKRLLSPNRLMVNYRMWNELTNSGYTVNMNLMDSLCIYSLEKFYEEMKNRKRESFKRETLKKQHEIHSKMMYYREVIKDVKKKGEKINERIILGKMNETQGDKMLEELKKELQNARLELISLEKEDTFLSTQLHNINQYINTDISSMTDETLNNEIHSNTKEIIITPLFKNNILTKDRIIDFYMNNGSIYTYKSVKRGNYFNITDKDGNLLDDFTIRERFKRKQK